jgi:carbohydrate-selective porin OprB
VALCKARYDGRLEVALTVDMQKAIGWSGLTFFPNGYQIHGQRISALNLGVLMPVSLIEALPATRLFELWLEQQLMGDNLTLRFGQLSADSEFAIARVTARFSTAREAGRRSWASISPMAVQPIPWRRRLRVSTSSRTTTSGFSSASSAAIQIAIVIRIFPRSAILTGCFFLSPRRC